MKLQALPVAEGFEKLSKKQQPVKGSIEDQIQMHVQNMERAREIYLRSLGALEVLESMKKGDSDGRSKSV